MVCTLTILLTTHRLAEATTSIMLPSKYDRFYRSLKMGFAWMKGIVLDNRVFLCTDCIVADLVFISG